MCVLPIFETRDNKAYKQNRIRNKKTQKLYKVATRALTKRVTHSPPPQKIPAELKSPVLVLINVTVNINTELCKTMAVTNEEIGRRVV